MKALTPSPELLSTSWHPLTFVLRVCEVGSECHQAQQTSYLPGNPHIYDTLPHISTRTIIIIIRIIMLGKIQQ
jgi:hypothetical protein